MKISLRSSSLKLTVAFTVMMPSGVLFTLHNVLFYGALQEDSVSGVSAKQSRSSEHLVYFKLTDSKLYN